MSKLTELAEKIEYLEDVREKISRSTPPLNTRVEFMDIEFIMDGFEAVQLQKDVITAIEKNISRLKSEMRVVLNENNREETKPKLEPSGENDR